MDIALVVLRVVVGLLLVAHGARKLFGWFGGGGLTATAWFFRSVGYRPSRLVAGIAGGVELVGGAAIAVGAGTPVAAAVVIAAMLNAALAVHTRNGHLALEGGYEYPLITGTVAAILGYTGAGGVSLDAALGFGGGGGFESEALVLALGLVAGAGGLVSRTAARSHEQSAPLWAEAVPASAPVLSRVRRPT